MTVTHFLLDVFLLSAIEEMGRWGRGWREVHLLSATLRCTWTREHPRLPLPPLPLVVEHALGHVSCLAALAI